MSSFPFEISHEHYVYALALLGVEDLSGVKSVVVKPGAVTVTRLRKDANRQCYLGPDGSIASEVVDISVERPKAED